MSTFGTMVATIRTACNKGASEDTRIKRQIVDSIALHRRERLRWNQGALAITLTADIGTYVGSSPGTGEATGVPTDLVAVNVDYLFLDYAGDADDRQRVKKVSPQRMNELRCGVPVAGAPCFWTIFGGKLELYPPSDLSTSILRGPYVKDAGTLSYTATTADPPVYTFLDPLGVAITDAYTSAWFDQKRGFNIIRHHAEWQLWTSVWQGLTGQGDQAAQRYAEALSAAQEITDLQQAPHSIAPWVPDFPGM